MACKRDCVIELINLIEAWGVQVNISKTKARGNKGIFCYKNGINRIDISRNIEDESLLPTLLHELAHFIHYQHDNTLKSLDFAFGKLNDAEYEELLNITVQYIPKDFASSLYQTKTELVNKSKEFSSYLKECYPEFKSSEPFKLIEKTIKYPVKYLLKYDCIRIFQYIYAVDTLEQTCPNLTKAQLAYIKLKSNKRKIAKLNAKINRLNKYYNQPSELWARFFELYFINKQRAHEIAPSICSKFEKLIESNALPEIINIKNILPDICDTIGGCEKSRGVNKISL